MNPLVIIPARGGSKGVPGKNIKLLNGKPLIQYTLDEARKLFDDSQICVSTDDAEIIRVLESLGYQVPFIRPAELATDVANTRDVINHAIDFYKNSLNKIVDVIILLQPTSPFRKASHISESLKLYTADLDMVVSVKETKSNPYYNLFEESKLGYLKKSKPGFFTRRQDCPKVWAFNGACYVINPESLKRKEIADFNKVLKYEMNEQDSHDIDSPLDWLIAQSLMK